MTCPQRVAHQAVHIVHEGEPHVQQREVVVVDAERALELGTDLTEARFGLGLGFGLGSGLGLGLGLG